MRMSLVLSLESVSCILVQQFEICQCGWLTDCWQPQIQSLQSTLKQISSADCGSGCPAPLCHDFHIKLRLWNTSRFLWAGLNWILVGADWLIFDKGFCDLLLYSITSELSVSCINTVYNEYYEPASVPVCVTGSYSVPSGSRFGVSVKGQDPTVEDRPGLTPVLPVQQQHKRQTVKW